jgi:hypothetical protein
MGFLLLSLVTVAYAGVSFSYFWSEQPGNGVVFAGYALANLGFLWGMR